MSACRVCRCLACECCEGCAERDDVIERLRGLLAEAAPDYCSCDEHEPDERPCLFCSIEAEGIEIG